MPLRHRRTFRTATHHNICNLYVYKLFAIGILRPRQIFRCKWIAKALVSRLLFDYAIANY